ncbi:MAG TPA: choice-of-anchor V domain-containing protein [Candidatus Sulfotelmatobacter sp.]|nr:choice-of-anchor V domain-containing protein [Candidatus Sulfotelmatobacter sp.]
MQSRLAYGISALFLAAGSTYAFATIESAHGPIASATHAPAIGDKPAEFVCTLCHYTDGDNFNVPGGGLRLVGVPIVYAAGQTYPLTVRLDSDSTADSPSRKWGFQLTAVRASDGEGAGTFVLPDPDTLQIIAGSAPFASRRYVEHTFIGTRTGLAGPSVWHLSWQAPATSSGKIYFFCAGNSANGNDDPSGDFIFTTSDSTLPPQSAAVPSLAALTTLAPPSPNPSRGAVRLEYSLARDGDVQLAIFDLVGRRIRTLENGWRKAGPSEARWDGTRDDGTNAAPGAYFARLSIAGAADPLTRKLTIAR